MKGVQYFFDDKGRPKAVMIGLKKNAELWEDFRDLMILEQRRKEPRLSAEDVGSTAP